MGQFVRQRTAARRQRKIWRAGRYELFGKRIKLMAPLLKAGKARESGKCR
ncbi:hypothetical protein KCP74_21355 [Salmonella enterica subsp. enterica]|nr:hypothetical protein KCP74_21355 [Salmonella enterica subsp. enterica]